MIKYNKKKILTVVLQLAGIALLVAVDLLIKKIVLDNIALYEKVDFIEGLFGWTYIQNTGVAWGMFDGNPQLLSVFTGVIIALGLIYLAGPFKRPLAYDIFIPVIIAGGLSNMIDRIMRGFVVDYIETLFIDFPVYNFADCLVCVGAFALVFYLIYEIIRDSKAEKLKKQGGAAHNE
ncbi:MAG: signal peptidase II [Clostridia bacterium]|nr:signal peptidase II [Clostridia bacterium]